jgi:hypothetical protein
MNNPLQRRGLLNSRVANLRILSPLSFGEGWGEANTGLYRTHVKINVFILF